MNIVERSTTADRHQNVSSVICGLARQQRWNLDRSKNKKLESATVAMFHGSPASFLSFLRENAKGGGQNDQTEGYREESARGTTAQRHLDSISSVLDRAKSMIMSSASPSLLDIGGADGAMSVELADRLGINDVTVVDPTNYSTQNDQGMKTITGTVFDVPVGDKTFSVVSCMMCLHHIFDRDDVLERIKILAPGGLLIVRDHDVVASKTALYLSALHVFFEAFTHGNPTIDMREDYFSKQQLQDQLASHGFEMVMCTDTEKRAQAVFAGLWKIPDG